MDRIIYLSAIIAVIAGQLLPNDDRSFGSPVQRPFVLPPQQPPVLQPQQPNGPNPQQQQQQVPFQGVQGFPASPNAFQLNTNNSQLQQQPPFPFQGNPVFPPIDGSSFNVPPGVKVVDPFNPWASTTYPSSPRPGDVIVRITPGQLVGIRQEIPNLFWTPDRDPRDQAPSDQRNPEQFPLNNQNNLTSVVYSFLGVPYAQKPVGNLRFKPPQKLPKFPTEIIYANKFGPACAQNIDARPTYWFEEPYPFDTNEDCLYLNIFTPRIAKAGDAIYPVIVFFHGGGFQTGSANDWPGHVLATKGVVVVTVNYRLGPFGFLSLGERGSGNYGLWDQRLSLDWVREYIYAFGGDRNRITIVGHDAGAASVGIHMLSPYSQETFQSAAAMSGSDLSYHQLITNPWLAYNNTVKLGRQVGCTQYTAREVMDCLLTRSTQDLVEGARDMFVEFNRYAFLPFVDLNFLPDVPKLMLQRKQVFSPVPFLTGISRQDGTETLLSDRDMARTRFHVDENYIDHKILDYVVKHNYTMNREAMIQAVKYLYTFWPDRHIDDKARDQYIYMCTDAYYTAPVSLSAQLRSEAGSIVYMYVNSYNISTGALNPTDYFMPYWMGVCHECDLWLLFGFPWMPRHLVPPHLRNVKWTVYDRNVSERFMARWAQFAKKKDPNLQNENKWFNYAPREHWYYDINVTDRIDRDFDWEHAAFWNVYMEQLSILVTTTFSPTMVAYRKELIAFKAATGTFVVLTCIAFTVAATLAYMLFEKRKRQRAKATKNGKTLKYDQYDQGFSHSSNF